MVLLGLGHAQNVTTPAPTSAPTPAPTANPTQNVTNHTASPTPIPDEADQGGLMTGVSLAFFGNLGIAASLCVRMHACTHDTHEHARAHTQVQKKAHNNIVADGDKIKFFQSPLWWVGMIANILGEVGNLLAYGFAPASVVAPVGAVGVVGNCVFAWYFLKELFGFRAIIGTVIVMLGVILIVGGAPEEPKIEMDVDAFYEFVVTPPSIVYFCLACVTGIVIYYFSRK
jgi:drug/metabolite transporter (DMT)-like permease